MGFDCCRFKLMNADVILGGNIEVRKILIGNDLMQTSAGSM